MRLKRVVCKNQMISPTLKKIVEKGKDCVVYRDRDNEYCWIVLVKENVVIEGVIDHYDKFGEEFQKFELDKFIETKEKSDREFAKEEGIAFK